MWTSVKSGITKVSLENRAVEVTSASEQISVCDWWRLNTAFRTGWQWGDRPGAEAASRGYTSGAQVLTGYGTTVPGKRRSQQHHICPTTTVMAEMNLQQQPAKTIEKTFYKLQSRKLFCANELSGPQLPEWLKPTCVAWCMKWKKFLLHQFIIQIHTITLLEWYTHNSQQSLPF